MNQSGITLCLAALILTFLNPGISSAQSIDPNRQRAIALWEEAIRAKGGRERLHAIQNFLISSTVDARDQTDREREMMANVSRERAQSVQGGPVFSTGNIWYQIQDDETQTERLYAGPGKAWIYTYNPTKDVSLDATLINGDKNACWVTLGPKTNGVPLLSRCLRETAIQYLLQDPIIYLMETSWVRPEPLAVRTEGKGRNQVDVIETKLGKIRVDFYLDRKTRLPIKLVTDWYGGISQATGKLGPMTVELRKYVEIDGIQMPTRVSRERNGDGEGPVGEPYRLDTERAAYQFNVAYDRKIFESPVPTTVKRGDWKARSDADRRDQR